ncbi:MAG: hypothetical protein COA99_17040 [Moraxellaceae bacterium]|nr:MAG: hypothetical protein COA99_17040 [Moraxellaceae bacterium]
MTSQYIKHLFFASILITLTACGGGGGGSDNSERSITPDDSDGDGIANDIDNFPLDAIEFEDAEFARCIKATFDDMEAVRLSEIIELHCFDMGITSVTNLHAFPSLDFLDLSDNELSDIDITQNTALTYLDLSNNFGLNAIETTYNTALTYLDLSNNFWPTDIDLTPNINPTFAALGLEEGDAIVSFNGMSIGDPMQDIKSIAEALEASDGSCTVGIQDKAGRQYYQTFPCGGL